MHRLLKERYTPEDLNGFIREGQASPFSVKGVGPGTARVAEVLNKEYEGSVDIGAIDHEHSPPVHLWARVDTKDGVPWIITATYLMENPFDSLSEEILRVLADEAGLVTPRNHPSFYLEKMHPLASFWPEKKVMQISFLNMPPDRVIAFLEKVEERLISAI